MNETISIVTPTFNEKDNLLPLIESIAEIMERQCYEYEHIVIDNCSTDGTKELLKEIAPSRPKLKVILNSRNFGQIRSPYYGTLQATGNACINLPSDFEVPLEIIPALISKWEEGYKVVFAVKEISNSSLLNVMKNFYYRVLNKSSDIELISNTSGFGLIDSKVVEILKEIDTPLPYYRGLLSEIGFEHAVVSYVHVARAHGRSKNNLMSLYDYGMVGFATYSKLPLKLMAIGGFVMAIVCFLVAAYYLIMKLMYWDTFEFGMAPILIGLFLVGSINALCIGILGEYIYMMSNFTRNMPLVVEEERLNFSD